MKPGALQNGYYSLSTTSPYATWYTKFVGTKNYSASQAKGLTVQVVTSVSLTSWVSPSNPSQYSWVTFTGTAKDQYSVGIPGAHVVFTCYYKTTTSNFDADNTNDPGGKAIKKFYVSRATKGYKVTVKSKATWRGLSANSTCYFTPQ